MANQFSLLRYRRFLPLFVVQFLGAFNDNFLKSLVVVLIAYGIWDTQGLSSAMVVSLAAALFILPLVIFCPFAGALSDRMDKAKLIRWIKLAEIGLVVAGIGALFSGSIGFAFAVIFGMGTHAAFFSPNKFSILPQHLSMDELVAGNGLVSTGTFLAILAGSMLGSLLAPMESGKEIASAILLLAALVGYCASRFIPVALPDEQNVGTKISFNFFVQGYDVIRFALVQKAPVLIAIIMTSWFYFVASTFHAQFPNFAKQVLGVDNFVLTLFLVLFSAGITVGGLLNNVVLRGRPAGTFVALACAAMGVFGIDIYFAARAYPAGDEALHNWREFLGHFQGLRLCTDMFLQAVAGGFLVVPLRAIVQARTAFEIRARVIAASNMMDAIFMLVSAILAMALFSVGIKIEELYLLVSSITFVLGLALLRVSSLKEQKVGSL